MPFRIGDRVTLGHGFTDGDIQRMAPGVTRQTVLICFDVNRHGSGRFNVETTGQNFWPPGPMNFWVEGFDWFIPVPEEYLLLEMEYMDLWVNGEGSQRMTLDQARNVVANDSVPGQEFNLIPLRSVFKFTVDGDGNRTETDYRNQVQPAVVEN